MEILHRLLRDVWQHRVCPAEGYQRRLAKKHALVNRGAVPTEPKSQRDDGQAPKKYTNGCDSEGAPPRAADDLRKYEITSRFIRVPGTMGFPGGKLDGKQVVTDPADKSRPKDD